MEWTRLEKAQQPNEVVFVKWVDKVVELKGAYVEYWAECMGMFIDDFFHPNQDNENYTHVSFLIEKKAEWVSLEQIIADTLEGKQ